MTENTSGIEPMEFNVLVLPDDPGDITPGGIIKPQELVDREFVSATTGMIVAVSQTAFTFEHGAQRAEPGDRVAFTRHAGMQVDGADGKKYFILKDKSIAAVYRKTVDAIIPMRQQKSKQQEAANGQ